MTKAMPFLQKVILLSYDPRLFKAGDVCSRGQPPQRRHVPRMRSSS